MIAEIILFFKKTIEIFLFGITPTPPNICIYKFFQFLNKRVLLVQRLYFLKTL